MVEPLIVDVREDLRRGGEPLPRILQAVNSLAPGQALRLRATFEPLPLYAVLGRKGFDHQSTRHAEGDWEVLFSPRASAPQQEAAADGGRAEPVQQGATDGWPKPSVVLDNRGLEPPEPLVRILEALEHLGPGQVLQALNERDPVFLYPQLKDRGAAIHTEKVSEGVRLTIRRAG